MPRVFHSLRNLFQSILTPRCWKTHFLLTFGVQKDVCNSGSLSPIAGAPNISSVQDDADKELQSALAASLLEHKQSDSKEGNLALECTSPRGLSCSLVSEMTSCFLP